MGEDGILDPGGHDGPSLMGLSVCEVALQEEPGRGEATEGSGQ